MTAENVVEFPAPDKQPFSSKGEDGRYVWELQPDEVEWDAAGVAEEVARVAEEGMQVIGELVNSGAPMGALKPVHDLLFMLAHAYKYLTEQAA